MKKVGLEKDDQRAGVPGERQRRSGAVIGAEAPWEHVLGFIGSVLAFLVLIVMSGSTAVSGETGNIVARINGVPLFGIDVDREFARLLPWSSYHGNLSPEKNRELRAQALQDAVRRELLAQGAAREGITADKGRVDEEIKAVIQRYGSRQAFEKALSTMGSNEAQFRRGIERELEANEYFRREVTEKAVVSDAEVRAHYDANASSFLRPEAVKLREILIKVDPASTAEEREELRAKAEELVGRIRRGENFGTLAYEHSMDEWSMKEGDLGVVHRGRLNPELEKAVFSLEPGAVSDVIETMYGFHIALVEERLPPTVFTYEEMRDTLAKKLEDAKKKELEDALMERLRKAATVTIVKEANER